VRHAEALAHLQPTQQKARLDASNCAEGRGADLAMKPSQGLVAVRSTLERICLF
jgi:hypothetical protein